MYTDREDPKVGDLVNDGLGNIGIVCKKTLGVDQYYVQFSNDPRRQLSGWYWRADLEVISESR